MTLYDLITRFSRYIHRISDIDVSQMCGLAEGTTSATIKTGNKIYYNLYNNAQLVKDATDNIAMTACAQQAISTFCYYLVSLNSLGTVTVTKGTNNTYALPSIPSGNAAIGAIKITTNGSNTFTSGTTDLSGTGITAVFYDIDAGIATFLINQAQKRLERGVTIIRNGRQIHIMDFDHMLIRTNIAIIQGATTITLPFSNYKDFKDEGLTITDSNNTIYPLFKQDFVPLGTNFQNRPCFISRLPTAETVFTTDGAPAMEFDIWPESDNAYTVNLIAYQYSPDLDGIIYNSNWLTDNASDILLFGALVEAASYFPADERIGEWKDRWQDAAFNLYTAQSVEKHPGLIYTRYYNPLSEESSLGIGTNEAGILSYGYFLNQ